MQFTHKHKQSALVILGVVAVVGSVWYFTTHNKRYYAQSIVKYGGTQGSIVELMLMDTGYLKAWAKALNHNNVTFSYNGKNYNSTGGAAIK